ncbi:MAG TPA: non-canonical purine NTP pyrophosphatase, RdgB/HAM1 family [Bacteroidales bacterium]|nr:non-canonical purine NTP pyrophosphatase, RdgB/HAM1 family [Bacteroidales bacterium]
MEILFATQNAHKIIEIQAATQGLVTLKSLNDYNFTDEIPETKPTIEENALEKAWYIYNKLGVNCFADDTGLEIEALEGEPGVFSARYAGEEKSSEANMKKVLQKMNGIRNRAARFKTVIALILNGKEYLFTGIVDGIIIQEPRGTEGFGYDPIFIPEKNTKTYAELSLAEKNTLSHRAKATALLVDFLKSHTV